MKKIALFSLITFLTLSISLISCGGGSGSGGNDGDKTPPVVDLNTLKPSIGQVITLDGVNGTGKLDFSANLKDNEGLASYSVEIHPNTSGHVDPKSLISPRAIPDKEPFIVKEKTVTLDGKIEASVKESFDIAPVPLGGKLHMIQDGSYHLVLIVKDKSGNRIVTIREFTIAYPKS